MLLGNKTTKKKKKDGTGAEMLTLTLRVLLSSAADGPNSDFDMSGPVLTRQQAVTTVSDTLHADQGQNARGPEDRNGGVPGRAASATYLYSPSSPRPRSHSGRLGFLWRRDSRAEVFVESFMFWLDTVEMVRVAGERSVFYSDWLFPVYIFSFLSTLRLAITPDNPLLSSAGFLLQDLPFFVLRVALVSVFGFVSPVLYLLKNALVSLTFIYFTLTRLKIFRKYSMF